MHLIAGDGVLLIAFNWMQKYFLSSATEVKTFFFLLRFIIAISTFFCFAHFHLLKQFIIAYIFCMLSSQCLFVCLFSQSFAIPCFTVTVLYIDIYFDFSLCHSFPNAQQKTTSKSESKRRGRVERKKCVYIYYT